MHIAVGLGNPGKEYERSRHNLGFMVVDELAQRLDIEFRMDKKCSALVAKSPDLVLIKPQTFMNDSGRAVRAWLSYYVDLSSEYIYNRLAVVYDDLDLPLGSWKWQLATAPKAHNGVNSIIAHLGTEQFWNGRVGIENRTAHRQSTPSSEYVLQPFLSSELEARDRSITEIADHMLLLLDEHAKSHE